MITVISCTCNIALQLCNIAFANQKYTISISTFSKIMDITYANNKLKLHVKLLYCITVWHKCLMGENFEEFVESKFHRQNSPFHYFAVELNNLSACTCNIYGLHESAY